VTDPGDLHDIGSRRRVRRRVAGLIYGLVLLLLWAAPVVALRSLSSHATIAEQDALTTTGSDVVTVGSRTDSHVTNVRVTASYTEPVDVPFPVSGIVTDVAVAPGQTITDGASLIAIDGQYRIAEVGGTPFYRTLSYGDSGADVTRLHELLDALGLGEDLAATDRYRWPTYLAVKELQRMVNAPVNGVFDPAGTVYVPAEFGTVDTVAAALGERVVAASPFLEDASVLEGATIEPSDGRPTTLFASTGSIVLRSGRIETALTSIRPTSGADLAAIEEFILSVQQSYPQPAQAPSATVVVDGVTAELASPPEFGAVPARAVVSDRSGTLCLRVVSGTSAETRAEILPLDLPAATEIGVALVPAELIGERVLADPPRLGEHPCG
jgi:hypothetical protein